MLIQLLQLHYEVNIKYDASYTWALFDGFTTAGAASKTDWQQVEV